MKSFDSEPRPITDKTVDDMIPPPEMLGSYEGDFKKIGDEVVRYFVELVNLKPEEKVLDVGCGIGRISVSLTRYLNREGRYDGFDIVPEWISWCQKKISSRYPNFHFELVDVFNNRYNLTGKYKASEYVFPYESETFDFVFLMSVFTHMVPEDMENYMKEITRVLKKGGRCLVTFFLLNEESLVLVEAGKSTVNFKYAFGNCKTMDPHTPELAIGYDESYVFSLYERYGLRIHQPVRYGSWCGRSDYYSYQDIIVASRE